MCYIERRGRFNSILFRGVAPPATLATLDKPGGGGGAGVVRGGCAPSDAMAGPVLGGWLRGVAAGVVRGVVRGVAAGGSA